MSFCNLRRNVQPQAQALPACATLTAKKRFEQLFYFGRGDGLTTISDGQSKQSLLCRRVYADGLVSRSMSEGVSNNIGNELSNSTPVAIYGIVDCEFGLDLTVRRGQAEFINNLMQDGFKRLA